MRFQSLMYSLALLPLLLWAAGVLWRRRPASLPFCDSFDARVPMTLRARLLRKLPWLSWLALALLLVAMARPQAGLSEFQVDAEGIAAVVCLDLSSSMRQRDLAPDRDRLQIAKEVIEDLLLPEGELPGRPNDVVGLVSFARYADAQCGLTLDHEMLCKIMASLQMVAPNSAEDGTAIGDALVRSIERLKDVDATSRIVILLTDGEQNAGASEPLQVAGLARSLGIKFYAIGVGRGAGMGLLQQVAEQTGGKAYAARDRQALLEVVDQIDRLETSTVDRHELTRWPEAFQPWVLAAFALLLLGSLLEATWLRSLP